MLWFCSETKHLRSKIKAICPGNRIYDRDVAFQINKEKIDSINKTSG